MSSPEAEKPAEAPPKPKRVPPLRLKAVVLMPLLLGVAALAYYFLVDGLIADTLLATSVSVAGENGEAEVEEVSFSIFGPKLRIRNLRAWQNLDDGTQHEVLNLGDANLDIDFWPLFERRLVVNDASITAVSYSQPHRAKQDRPKDHVPTDTNNPQLNDYLKEVREVLESQDLDDLRNWLEKLKEYSEKIPEGEEEEEKKPVTLLDPGPADRASYVKQALKSQRTEPRFLVKHAGLNELNVSLGKSDGKRFVSKVTDVNLTADAVSSDPIAYGQAMQFRASGDLDGDEGRRVELGLTLRFDPDELVTLEQVDGAAGIRSLDISSMVDADMFGSTLREARLSVMRYAGEHTGMPGRTRLQIAGLIDPPDYDAEVRASFSLWFGGFGSGANAAFAPSGISVQVENFPLDPILQLAGESPLPLEDRPATITFGTCDAQGNMGTPDAAFTWHDGVAVRLRLKVNGLRFAEQEGELGGLPAEFVLRGLNRVVDGMGGLDVVVGFQGKRDNIALDLERPGLRGFVDAVVNALEMTGPEIESLVELPFAVTGASKVALASVNADGTLREPALNLDGEPRHDLNDLRVALTLRDATITPKPGQDNVAGLPPEDFCRAFNRFMQTLGPEGLTLRTRLMNEQGVFSPALESPGMRGLVDSMVGVLDYTGTQLNQGFDLPFTVSPETIVKLASVDADGGVRTYASPGGDSGDLSGLRVRAIASNMVVSPKRGQATIAGIPSGQFCTTFNSFLKQQQNGLTVQLGVFDGKGAFSPSLQQPGTRGLIDGIANTLSYSGAEINQSFDLPFELVPDAAATSSSVDAKGKARTMDGPGSASQDLNDLTLGLNLKNGYAAKKKGHDTILGIPADHFTYAWNRLQKSYPEGFPMRVRVFDGKGKFAPTLVGPTEKELIKQLGNATGIDDFGKNFGQLAEKYAKDFPAFQKGGLDAAKDIASGKTKLPEIPKEIPKEVPKDVPKLPDPPKLPPPPKLPG